MTMESAKRILALLPGVDCGGFGGCGCPTCEACAQAIAEGAPITLCPAADTETVAKIAEIMGVEPVEVEGSKPSKGEPAKLKALLVVLPD